MIALVLLLGGCRRDIGVDIGIDTGAVSDPEELVPVDVLGRELTGDTWCEYELLPGQSRELWCLDRQPRIVGRRLDTDIGFSQLLDTGDTVTERVWLQSAAGRVDVAQLLYDSDDPDATLERVVSLVSADGGLWAELEVRRDGVWVDEVADLLGETRLPGRLGGIDDGPVVYDGDAIHVRGTWHTLPGPIVRVATRTQRVVALYEDDGLFAVTFAADSEARDIELGPLLDVAGMDGVGRMVLATEDGFYRITGTNDPVAAWDLEPGWTPVGQVAGWNDHAAVVEAGAQGGMRVRILRDDFASAPCERTVELVWGLVGRGDAFTFGTGGADAARSVTRCTANTDTSELGFSFGLETVPLSASIEL